MDMATATAHAARLDVAEPAASADDGRHVWAARDGTPILVRAITPDDFQLEREFVEGLSPQAGYQRLMSSRKPSAEELQRWTVVDREREGALIATTSGHGRERQVGVARYAMDAGDDAAEFAIVISDAWHGMGLGTHLLSSLIDLARQSGVRRIFGTTLSENASMLRMGRRMGFKPSRLPGAGFITMLSLDLPEVLHEGKTR